TTDTTWDRGSGCSKMPQRRAIPSSHLSGLKKVKRREWIPVFEATTTLLLAYPRVREEERFRAALRALFRDV
ncbi:MAG: hypothetical protein ACI9K5_004017, partial [Gammaproteobacteria bacterium]